MSNFNAINDFYIITPTFTDFLQDRIYIKRPGRSYITLFSKNYFYSSQFSIGWYLKNK